MCIAVPVQVLRLEGTSAVCVDRAGAESRVDVRLVGAVAPGTWLLAFLGAAREVIDAEHAARVGEALEALAAAMRGDPGAIEAAFADLIGREPELPPHLRQE